MVHYDRNIVLAAYRAQHPDRHSPTDRILKKFDNLMWVRYDGEVTRQASAYEIELTRFTRSMLMFFAARSNAKHVTTRVNHAFAFFKSVNPMEWRPDSEPDSTPPVVAAGD